MITIPFDTSKNYTLEDDCVLLRPLLPGDHLNLLPFALNEPEIWKFSLVPVAGSENLQKYIDTAARGREEGKEYPFAVFDKRTQEYAGSTRFYDLQLANKTVQLGYTWYGHR